jgi:hypothetical protein
MARENGQNGVGFVAFKNLMCVRPDGYPAHLPPADGFETEQQITKTRIEVTFASGLRAKQESRCVWIVNIPIRNFRSAGS